MLKGKRMESTPFHNIYNQLDNHLLRESIAKSNMWQVSWLVPSCAPSQVY